MNERSLEITFDVLTELLFALLPFVVIAIVAWYCGGGAKFFFSPDASIATSVLVGQALRRFIVLTVKERSVVQSIRAEGVALIFVFVMVFALLPSLTALVQIYLNSDLLISEAVARKQMWMMSWGLVTYSGLTWLSIMFAGAPAAKEKNALRLVQLSRIRSGKRHDSSGKLGAECSKAESK